MMMILKLSVLRKKNDKASVVKFDSYKTPFEFS